MGNEQTQAYLYALTHHYAYQILISQGRPVQTLPQQLQQEFGISPSRRYLFLPQENGEIIVSLPSDTTALWLPNPTEISTKDAYRPYDILNTEFRDMPMKLADIKIGEPDELGSKDLFQDLLIEGIEGIFHQDILIEGPLLP